MGSFPDHRRPGSFLLMKIDLQGLNAYLLGLWGRPVLTLPYPDADPSRAACAFAIMVFR